MAIKKKKLKRGEDRIVLRQPETVAHHRLAEMHRDMSDQEFEGHKASIDLNGQIVPVVLYRDLLVDGRHRQRALIELGIHDMKCVILPNNLTLAEVKERVMATENRRTDNVAQKAIRAWRWYNETGSTQEEAALKFGVDRTNVSQAKKLYDETNMKTMDKLYNQGYLMLAGKRMTQIPQIRKVFNSDPKEQPEREPVNARVASIMSSLKEMEADDDFVGVAQIESYAKKLRQR